MFPFVCQLPESLCGHFNVPPWRLLGFLRYRMQDIHGFSELGDIKDSMDRSRIYPNLIHTQAYVRHRLPVARVQPLLDPPQLMTHLNPGLRRKLPDEFETVSEPDE